MLARLRGWRIWTRMRREYLAGRYEEASKLNQEAVKRRYGDEEEEGGGGEREAVSDPTAPRTRARRSSSSGDVQNK